MDTRIAGPDPRLVQLCHDLRQYVAAGALVAQVPDQEPLSDATRQRFDTLSQLFQLMSEMILAELGQDETRAMQVDLRDMVDESVQVLGLREHASVAIRADGPALGWADPVLLRRAVCNVLDNAVRAAGPRGSVSISIDSDAARSCIEVTDDGLGFGRISAGHGQGMSIVGTVLAACHGRLEIASGPGPGTTVRMFIPAPPCLGRIR